MEKSNEIIGCRGVEGKLCCSQEQRVREKDTGVKENAVALATTSPVLTKASQNREWNLDVFVNCMQG